MKAEMRAIKRHVESEMSSVERAKVRKRSVGMPRGKDCMARKVCHMLMCGRAGGSDSGTHGELGVAVGEDTQVFEFLLALLRWEEAVGGRLE